MHQACAPQQAMSRPVLPSRANPLRRLEGLKALPEVQRGKAPSRLCPHATRLVCANQRCVAARDRRPPERTCTPGRPVLLRGHTRDGAGQPRIEPRRLPVLSTVPMWPAGTRCELLKSRRCACAAAPEKPRRGMGLNSSEKTRGPVPCGYRASEERGRVASAGPFSRCVVVIQLTTEVMCIGERCRLARQLPFLRPLRGSAPAQGADDVDGGGEMAVHGGAKMQLGRRLGLMGHSRDLSESVYCEKCSRCGQARRGN
jgi:hypothetical protein